MKRAIAMGVFLFSAGVVNAGELLVTESSGAKSFESRRLALDVATDGEVAAMQFAIKFPGKVASIDVSKCLAELPSSHTGLCEAKPELGMVAVVLWSGDNATLPAGVVAIGSVSARYSGGRVEGNGQAVEIQKLHMSSGDAKPVLSEVRNFSGPNIEQGSLREH